MKTYHPLFTHFTAPNAQGENAAELVGGPVEIALVIGDRVWFVHSYMVHAIAGVKQESPMSEDGCAIFSLPMGDIEFWTPEEAESLAQAKAMDDELLSYM